MGIYYFLFVVNPARPAIRMPILENQTGNAASVYPIFPLKLFWYLRMQLLSPLVKYKKEIL